MSIVLWKVTSNAYEGINISSDFALFPLPPQKTNKPVVAVLNLFKKSLPPDGFLSCLKTEILF